MDIFFPLLLSSIGLGLILMGFFCFRTPSSFTWLLWWRLSEEWESFFLRSWAVTAFLIGLGAIGMAIFAVVSMQK